MLRNPVISVCVNLIKDDLNIYTVQNTVFVFIQIIKVIQQNAFGSWIKTNNINPAFILVFCYLFVHVPNILLNETFESYFLSREKRKT